MAAGKQLFLLAGVRDQLRSDRRARNVQHLEPNLFEGSGGPVRCERGDGQRPVPAGGRTVDPGRGLVDRSPGAWATRRDDDPLSRRAGRGVVRPGLRSSRRVVSSYHYC